MEQEILRERYELAAERVGQIARQAEVREPFGDFFVREARFLQLAMQAPDPASDIESLRSCNKALYEDVLGERYQESYGNPAFAAAKLGRYGQAFSFLYAELAGIRGAAVEYAFYRDRQEETTASRLWEMTVLLELFLEIYGMFSACEGEDEADLPTAEQVKAVLVSYAEDYCEQMTAIRIRASLDPGLDFARTIIMESDLSDERYLYRFGEYIGEDERKLAAFLGTLSQEEIDAMAATYTGGYRDGFIAMRKDLSKKKTVEIRYHLGFERIVRQAVIQFEEMGLSPVFRRYALHAVNRSVTGRAGYTGTIENPQYEYDHRQDSALFLSEEYVSKRLRALQNAYQDYRELAGVYGGPAVMETFGETPFDPESKKESLTFSPAQQALQRKLIGEAVQITARYIKPQERSFTVIAYPLPQIGADFPEIFAEVAKVNTLPSDRYREIQQKIIDVLDTCEWVWVRGKGENETDIIIHLHELKHPVRQTNFENCVADVNIPVGEVFTSPVLAGTGGVLHVSGVYLNGLYFKDLKLVFDCGQVIDYSCANFASEEDNRRYIEENILFHHAKIPMGEFAIGTNTTAYRMAKRFGIEDRLPILIAEKMGPHFAVGDTCYAREEDVRVYNPDGKEVIARENELSALRNEDEELAYYNCHTDITLPYEELESICVIDDDGETSPILLDGRFVVPGTEELNIPLEHMDQ